MNSFFTLHMFLEVGKTQDLPSKIWQTLGDALTSFTIAYHSMHNAGKTWENLRKKCEHQDLKTGG
jgi:hypothetical protein